MPYSMLRLRSTLPVVLGEGFRLSETEVAGRIGAGFRVAREVAEQGVCHGIAGGVGIAAGVEVDVAGVVGTAVLIDAIANDDYTRFDDVVAFDD